MLVNGIILIPKNINQLILKIYINHYLMILNLQKFKLKISKFLIKMLEILNLMLLYLMFLKIFFVLIIKIIVNILNGIPFKISFIGYPFSGRKTQAEILNKKYNHFKIYSIYDILKVKINYGMKFNEPFKIIQNLKQ